MWEDAIEEERKGREEEEKARVEAVKREVDRVLGGLTILAAEGGADGTSATMSGGGGLCAHG
jgi:hypothetical protein